MAGYRKRGKTWEAYLNVGKDAEGNYIKKFKCGFKTKKEAEAWVTDVNHEFNAGLDSANSGMLLKDLMAEWYKNVISKKAINTRYNNMSRMNSHILPELGDYPLDKLTPLIIQRFYNDLGEKGLAPSSKKKIIETLSSPLRYAKRLKLIYSLPTDIEKDKIVKSKIVYWTDGELMAFLDFVQGKKIYLPTLIMGMTGMRPAELVGLQYKKVDLVNRTIKINAQVVKDKESNELVLTDIVKTESSYRDISMPGVLIDELKKIRKENKEIHTNSFIITDKNGHMTSYDNLRVMFHRYTNKLRIEQREKLLAEGMNPEEVEDKIIKDIPFYNLRHTHATILLNNGENIKVISERLGHSSIKTILDTYATVMPKSRTNTASILDEIFKNK